MLITLLVRAYSGFYAEEVTYIVYHVLFVSFWVIVGYILKVYLFAVVKFYYQQDQPTQFRTITHFASPITFSYIYYKYVWGI